MRALIPLMLTVVLCGCQTPAGVRQTATLVSTLSTKLNGQISNYVSAGNDARQDDAQRLATIEEQSNRRVAANADQFKVLDLAGDTRSKMLLAGLQSPVAQFNASGAGTDGSIDSSLRQAFGQNTYDSAPLKNEAAATGALGKPLDSQQTLTALFSFAKAVNDDLAANASATTKTSSATPSPAPAAPPAPTK
jgi:hypothetical protein